MAKNIGPESTLIIGPLKFTYHVQSINCQQVKSVEIIEPTRDSNSYIADSGESTARAQISLIFPGLNNINYKLRKLVALFRVCPFVLLENEHIAKVFGEEHCFVALEQLTLRTVPDVLDTIAADLTVAQVEPSVTSNSKGKRAIYLTEEGESSRRGQDAFWLNKWIDELTEKHLPTLSFDSFKSTQFRFELYNTLGTDLIETLDSENFLAQLKKTIYPDEVPSFRAEKKTKSSAGSLKSITFDRQSSAKVTGFSATLYNKIAYSKITSKTKPYGIHMGGSAISGSVDITFNTTYDNNNLFEGFFQLSELSEKFIKSTDRSNRVTGWSITHPILTILQKPLKVKNYKKDLVDLFVPYQVVANTTDVPNVKQVSFDFTQTTLGFIDSQNVLLDSGGTDAANLAKFVDLAFEKEYQYRTVFSKEDRYSALQKLSSLDPEIIAAADMFKLVWAIDSNIVLPSTRNISRLDNFGLLNRDTLRATILTLDRSESSKINVLLSNTVLGSGRIKLNKPLDFITELKTNIEYGQQIITGLKAKNPELIEIYEAIRTSIVPVIVSGAPEEFTSILALKLTYSLLGDYTGVLDISSESGEAIQMIANSEYKIQHTFVKALTDVILTRPSTPLYLDNVFSPEGISTAFFKLIIAYNNVQQTLGDNFFPSIGRDPLSIKQRAAIKTSTYPDIPLPTYEGLFGDRWKEFAPTFYDLGIPNITSDKQVPDIKDTTASLLDLLDVPAVDADDTVHPAIWFYNKGKPSSLSPFSSGLKDKNFIDTLLSTSADTAYNVMNAHTITLPYDVAEIDELEKLYEQSISDPKKKTQLSAAIESSFIREREKDKKQFEDAMRNIRLYNTKQTNASNKIDNSQVYLFVSYKENNIQKRKVTFPGLGGEMYRVAKERFFIDSTEALPELSSDSVYKSSAQDSQEDEFVRHTLPSIQATLKSSVAQLEKLKESYVNLFPALKVYLLDFRGDDLYADDSFFTLNPIVSVDVSLDKDDADLAIIKIADPLYNLQSSLFPAGNVVRSYSETEAPVYEASKQGHTVFSTLKGTELTGGYLKRYRIVQGRGVQIKMGYDSNAKNLKTVFNGRISEILPGDVLTLVCQGWKAELINRQVSFYNDDPNSWGARDLAIQAMVKAQPFGFGEYYTRRDANYILKNVKDLDIQSAITKALDNTQTIRTDEYGSSPIKDTLVNAVFTTLGFGSSLKRNIGIDTRLKNIWYPDAPNASNFLGWRSITGIMPSYMNNGWIVPMKPAWDVLKEASRHAWNCIVQVVPYDGRATLFMGHPDQPYYFTNGDPIVMSKWRKYTRHKETVNTSIKNDLLKGFLNSNYYKGWDDVGSVFSPVDLAPEDGVVRILTGPLLNTGTALIRLKSSYALLKSALTYRGGVLASGQKNPFTEALAENLKDSLIPYLTTTDTPLEIYTTVRDNYLGTTSARFFVSAFFDVEPASLISSWPNIDKDITLFLDDFSKIKNIDAAKASLEVYGNPSVESIPNEISKILENLQLTGVLISYQTKEALAATFSNIYNFNRQLFNLIPKSPEAIDAYDKLVETINEYTNSIKSLDSSDLSDFRKRRILKDAYIKVEASYSKLQDIVVNYQNSLTKNKIPDSGDPTATFTERLFSSIIYFKSFVYFFCKYILENADARAKLSHLVGKAVPSLPPNMQVFRVHHWADSSTDIIANNIVASTKEMWNTVVIEHPAKAVSKDKLGSDEVFTEAKVNSGINWEYWPPTEITGVYGLQFHPGLTLANKKIKIFTELNAYTPELCAKLACTHLAEGLRKIYRGTLILRGKQIKPHDRIVLADKEVGMGGTIEVESVIHSWNATNGWTTTIVPQLIADANPGASILQTAALQGIYNIIFNSIDFISEVVTYAIIISTLGGATPLTAGEFSVSKGLTGIIKNLVSGGGAAPELASAGFKNTILKALNSTANNAFNIGGKAVGGALRLSPIKALTELYKDFGGPVNTLLKNYAFKQGANQLAHLVFNLHVVNGFIKSTKEYSQLPVTVCPLIFESHPFLAGLETDSPIWDVFVAGLFYDSRKLNEGAERILQALYNYATSNDDVTIEDAITRAYGR